MQGAAPLAALMLLVPALPVAIWAAWSDMKFMRIPNMAVLALVLGFAVVGPFALGLGEWAWRWTHLAVILAIGFVAAAARMVGAGDAKFAAAMAPYVALADLRLFLALFAAATLAAFAAHRLMRATPAFRRATPDWASWTHAQFPMGLALAGALIAYLMQAAVP